MSGMYWQDVNRRQVTLGIMFIADNEIHDKWAQFLSFVRESEEWHEKVLITDQGRGADTAEENELEAVKQFFCSYRRKMNIIKNAYKQKTGIFTSIRELDHA